MTATVTDLVEVEHHVDIAAPADLVYGLVADVTAWPQIFTPTVHVEVLERAAGSERLHLWATANGEVRDWISRRELHADTRTIDFRQEVSSAPVAEMGGRWIVTAVSPEHTRVQLLHDYRATAADQLPWIAAAVDRNSSAELQALAVAAELADQHPGIAFSFIDSIDIDGDPSIAYDFLAAADRWPERLPHVAELRLTVDDAGVQHMMMDTRAPDGTVHTTESFRVCFDGSRIVYKQTVTPPIMSAHTGEWTVSADGHRLQVSSQHTVRLRPEGIAEVLGDAATPADAAAQVQKILSGNSRLTLAAAKRFTEQARQR